MLCFTKIILFNLLYFTKVILFNLLYFTETTQKNLFSLKFFFQVSKISLDEAEKFSFRKVTNFHSFKGWEIYTVGAVTANSWHWDYLILRYLVAQPVQDRVKCDTWHFEEYTYFFSFSLSFSVSTRLDKIIVVSTTATRFSVARASRFDFRRSISSLVRHGHQTAGTWRDLGERGQFKQSATKVIKSSHYATLATVGINGTTRWRYASVPLYKSHALPSSLDDARPATYKRFVFNSRTNGCRFTARPNRHGLIKLSAGFQLLARQRGEEERSASKDIAEKGYETWKSLVSSSPDGALELFTTESTCDLSVVRLELIDSRWFPRRIWRSCDALRLFHCTLLIYL